MDVRFFNFLLTTASLSIVLPATSATGGDGRSNRFIASGEIRKSAPSQTANSSDDRELDCATLDDFGAKTPAWDNLKQTAGEAGSLKVGLPVKTENGIRIREFNLRYSKSRAVVDLQKCWTSGQDLVIEFVDHTDDDAVIEKVMNYARQWEQYTNLRFRFRRQPETAGRSDAQVTVSLNGPGWSSALGTDSLARKPGQASMNLKLSASTAEQIFRRHVLHEFGHVLGFRHEHQNPRAGIKWKEPAAIAFYKRKNPDWSDDDVRRNILDPASGLGIRASLFDPLSIMLYPIPPGITDDGADLRKLNNELSEIDKAIAATLYPLERNTDLRVYFKIAPGFIGNGVTVCAVDRKSPLAHLRDPKGNPCPFRPGSVVNHWGGKEIGSLGDFRKAIGNANSRFRIKYFDPDHGDIDAIGPEKGNSDEWPD